MNLILTKRNHKTQDIFVRFKQKPNFMEADKYTWTKEIGHIEINALFELFHMRRLFGMNYHRADYLFAGYCRVLHLQQFCQKVS